VDEVSFSGAGRKIKNEPSTPAAPLDDPDVEKETPATATTKPSSRRGAGAATSNKRKRAEPEPEPELEAEAEEKATPSLPSPSEQEPPLSSPQQPATITAFRNFQKMTVPIMNNITSHKHASLFATPVKERDAEGYSELIKRPQDLKSIRAAVAAGSRAVAAATASAEAAGTPGTPRGGAGTPSAGGSGGGISSTGATVKLPWSIDLVPPRGIVNGAQLEQEVMRMFANAVMFNVGDEGVVRDTVEMFKSVVASIAAWRAAERNAAESRGVGGAGRAEDEGDEVGEEEGTERSAKRRRA